MALNKFSKLLIDKRMRGEGVEPSRENPLDPKFQKCEFLARSFLTPDFLKLLIIKGFKNFYFLRAPPFKNDKKEKIGTLLAHFFKYICRKISITIKLKIICNSKKKINLKTTKRR